MAEHSFPGITRRQFMKTSAAAALSSLLPRNAYSQSASGKRPNLLFVFSDQQSADMLGCYGNPSIKTPRLDAFAKDSVQFNHCISNSPVCTPFRGILLSGLHPLHNGALFNDIQMLPGKGKYFAEVLRDSGYRTGYVGKWHLFGGDRDRPVPRGPLRYGFDDYYLTNNCTLEFRAGKSWYWNHNNQRAFYQKWEPDAQTDQAIEFLERNAGSAKPWSLFLSWHPPHNWFAPDKSRHPAWKYDAPEEFTRQYDPHRIKLRPKTPETAENRRIMRDYYALCSNIDWNFGRLLDTLEEQGELDNTIIVFTSDHGDCLHMDGRYNQHKCRPEQEAARIPLLIRAPGVSSRKSDLIISSLDFMPTLLGLMGTPVPNTCHGQDLSSAIREGDDRAVRSTPLFMSAFNDLDWRGVYTHRYTYSFGPDGKRFNRLYDRKKDPHEQRNLYDDPMYRKLQKSLHEETLRWMEKFGDAFVPYQKILEATAQAPDPEGKMYRMPTGALKGPPVDMIRGMKGHVEL